MADPGDFTEQLVEFLREGPIQVGFVDYFVGFAVVIVDDELLELDELGVVVDEEGVDCGEVESAPLVGVLVLH